MATELEDSLARLADKHRDVIARLTRELEIVRAQKPKGLSRYVLIDVLQKLKTAVGERRFSIADMVELLVDACYGREEHGDIPEIAETILEILEPDRIGHVRWVDETLPEDRIGHQCKECGRRFSDTDRLEEHFSEWHR
jgi:hypothetical protein